MPDQRMAAMQTPVQFENWKDDGMRRISDELRLTRHTEVQELLPERQVHIPDLTPHLATRYH